MEIIVCVKRVPVTQEVDLEIASSGKDIKRDMLAYMINEWDNYAIEEAVSIKERLGGNVTAITVGYEDDEEVLRRCLAMGADRAIRIDPEGKQLDPYVISKALFGVIKEMPYDLILTGVQTEDLNEGMVGVMLAEQLGITHLSVVNSIEYENGRLKVKVELEGGVDEVSSIALPALLSIQTGINEPRYVSIMGIRKAAKKELKVISINELGLLDEELLPWIQVEELFLPPETEGAEILEGDPDTIADEIIKIIKEKGVNL